MDAKQLVTMRWNPNIPASKPQPALGLTPVDARSQEAPGGRAGGVVASHHPAASMPGDAVRFAANPAEASGEPPDVLRHSPLRLWGYANEFGESLSDVFRHVWGKDKANRIVRGSYGVVGKYVVVDVFDKAMRGYREAERAQVAQPGRLFHAVEQAADAGMFQSAASLTLSALLVSVLRDSSKFTLFSLLNDRAGRQELLRELQHEARQNPHAYERLLGRIKLGVSRQLEKLPVVRHGLRDPVIKPLLPHRGKIAKGVPMLMSLSLIPVVVHPLDLMVNKAMDWTYRPVMRAIKKQVVPQLFQGAWPVQRALTTSSPSLAGQSWMHQHFVQYR